MVMGHMGLCLWDLWGRAALMGSMGLCLWDIWGRDVGLRYRVQMWGRDVGWIYRADLWGRAAGCGSMLMGQSPT